MQSIAPGHANISGSAERHEIGRNGSFWMPEKTRFTKTSSTNKSSKDASSAKDVLRDLGTKASSSGKGSRSVSKEFNISKENSSNKAKKNTVFNGRGKSLGETISVTLSKNSSGNENLRIQPNIGFNQYATHSKMLIQNVLPVKISAHNKLQSTSSRLPLRNLKQTNVKSDEQGSDSKFDEGSFRENAGTKSALDQGMFSYINANLMNLISVDLENKNNDVSCLAKDLVNLFGNKILPRISSTEFSGKRVFRFSLDMPDGKTLGVRFQKDPEGSTLCFINPDGVFKDFLNKIAIAMEKSLNRNENMLKILQFNSFAQMDHHFNNYSS